MPETWSAVLEGEFAKARTIQDEQPALKSREMEQAVLAAFLSSQPIGQKAHTPELIALVGATRPDRIELEKGLRRWTDLSWFLDESEFSGAAAMDDGSGALPGAWRLGNRPNLKQMHHDACTNRVTAELVEQKLLAEVRRTRSLTQGASGAGARVHTLPERPRDIEDDGEFHFALLGPGSASDSGRPSAQARRFIDETTGPDRPRTRRNAIVLVVPSRDGLDVARVRIREYLGWAEVRSQIGEQAQDTVREAMLATSTEQARRRIPMRSGKRGPSLSPSARATPSMRSRRRSARSPCSRPSRPIAARAFRTPRSAPRRCCRVAPTICGARASRRAA